jgi:hypothetical protein
MGNKNSMRTQIKLIPFIDILKYKTEKLHSKIDELLGFSSINPISINKPDSLIVIIGPEYSWNNLSPEGLRLQDEIYKEYNHFCELIEFLLSNRKPQTFDEFLECKREILPLILQNERVWESDLSCYKERIHILLNKQFSILNSIKPRSSPSNLFIIDTNALIYNPKIEEYDFGLDSIIILLVPSVLQELDKLKIEHRNDNVRIKAELIIRKIKEYARRGSISEGVKIKNKIILKSIAIEPKMDKALSWLDHNNPDDRLIASTFEIIRDNLFSPVILVTRDINLQNKAAFSGLHFIEPPDPL